MEFVTHILRSDARPGEPEDLEIRQHPDGSLLKCWVELDEWDGAEWKSIGPDGPKHSEKRARHCSEKITKAEVVQLVHRYAVPSEFQGEFITRSCFESVNIGGAEATLLEAISLLEMLFERVDIHREEDHSAMSDKIADGMCIMKTRMAKKLSALADFIAHGTVKVPV